jgi:hypothetical protein
MLYLHLLTLADSIDQFVIGHSNLTFTNQPTSPMSLSPFDKEISAFSNQILFIFIPLANLPLSHSKWRDELAWKREATARNFLLEGVKQLNPQPDDLILLCDVDEIVTAAAIELVRHQPPAHYYNLFGVLYHYSYRWVVGDWERPLIIRFGSVQAPLDDYKFMPFLFPLPGVLHHHCSFCFPRMSEVLKKLKSFSHTEFSEGRFRDPNYVYARIACGFGVLPPQYKMPEQLKLVEFNAGEVFLPKDPRFDFLRQRIGFIDLADFALNRSLMESYRPKTCNVSFASSGSILA